MAFFSQNLDSELKNISVVSYLNKEKFKELIRLVVFKYYQSIQKKLLFTFAVFNLDSEFPVSVKYLMATKNLVMLNGYTGFVLQEESETTEDYFLNTTKLPVEDIKPDLLSLVEIFKPVCNTRKSTVEVFRIYTDYSKLSFIETVDLKIKVNRYLK